MTRGALRAVMLKEIRQTIRDKRVLAVLLVSPLMQVILLGYAVNLDVYDVPTVAADEDRSLASRAFIEGLTAGDTFRLDGVYGRAEDAIDEVKAGRASVALVVPRGYARDRMAGRPAAVQVLTDGSDSNRAIVAQNAISGYSLGLALADVEDRLARASAARGVALRLPSVIIEPRVFYNPTLDSATYFVPGIAATLLLIVAIIVTSMGLAREREAGTLEQVMVTPIQPLTLIIGKTLPYGVIALFDLGLVVMAAIVLFHVPMRGSLVVLYAGASLFLLSVLGIGLFVSTMVRNQQQAFMTAIFFVMPAILLSGFVTPVANMPSWLQPITLFDPVRHFVEILRAVMLKGAGFADLAPQLTWLAGIGVTVYGLATLAMARRLS